MFYQAIFGLCLLHYSICSPLTFLRLKTLTPGRRKLAMDLDDTLWSCPQFHESYLNAMFGYVQHTHDGMDLSKAKELGTKLYQSHGSTIHGLLARNKGDSQE